MDSKLRLKMILKEADHQQIDIDSNDDNSHHDDSDVIEHSLQYDVNIWWKDDEPLGYTFKGKSQDFSEAIENFKLNMKKGLKKQTQNLQMKDHNSWIF